MKKSQFDLEQSDPGKEGLRPYWLGGVMVAGAIVIVIAFAAYLVWPVGSKRLALLPVNQEATTVSATATPAGPWPDATINPIGMNITSDVIEGLQLTVTDIEPLPNGKLRFWLLAQNQSADAKTLPLDNFMVIDENTKIQYRADPRESRWIVTVAAQLPGSVGQITLDRPLVADVSQISIGFSGMRDVPDIFIKNVPVKARTPVRVDVELRSPYIDGLQLGVTRVENSDGNLRVWIEAKHIDVGWLPFVPSPLALNDAGKLAEQTKETEGNMREWRYLRSAKLTFQDNEGRVYDVDSTRSEWDREVLNGGRFKGYVTISHTLESSVTQLTLIYQDIQHTQVIQIPGIPVPQSDGSHASAPIADLSFAPCVVVSGVPDFKDRVSEAQMDRMLSLPPKFAKAFAELGIEPNSMLYRTPQVPIATPITRTLNIESEQQCGVTLGVRTVSQSADKMITRVDITVKNQSEWPQRTPDNGLEISDAQGRTYQYKNWFCYNFVLCPPWMPANTGWTASLDITGLPPELKELQLSLRLAGGQVILLEHVLLPDLTQTENLSLNTSATTDSSVAANPNSDTSAIADSTVITTPLPDSNATEDLPALSAGVEGVTLTNCTVTTRFEAQLSSAPSMENAVTLAVLPIGHQYQSIKRTGESPMWFFVTDNGQEGWVSSDYLVVDPTCVPKSSVEGVALTNCTVTTEFEAELFSEPSMENTVALTILPIGRQYQSIKRADEFPTWFFVTDNGHEGWVLSDQLTVSDGCTN